MSISNLIKQNIISIGLEKLITDFSKISESIVKLSSIKITKRMVKRVINNLNKLPEFLNFNITIDKKKIKIL